MIMKVLLADDEKIIRDGVRDHIDWAGIGFELVGTACDGVEALELFEHFRPVIVITDIKMPEIDGLELIRRIHAQSPEVVLVILSAYAEFRIAQEAMKFGVRHYLLKPIDPIKLVQVLEAARDDFLSAVDSTSLNLHKYLFDTAVGEAERITNPTIRRAARFVIDRHEDPQLTLGTIAEEIVHVHPDYLSRTFKKTVGIGFSRFLLHIRILHAMDLIRARPDLSNRQLAQMVGFGEKVSYFGEAFVRATGTTVRQFRSDPSQEIEVHAPEP